MVDNRDRPRSPEEGQGMNLTVRLPFEEDSLMHKQVQGVTTYGNYPDIGTMVYKRFRRLYPFLDEHHMGALSQKLSAEAFQEIVVAEKAAYAQKLFKKTSVTDERYSVTLPVRIGSPEHYAIEAISARNGQDRHRFLGDITAAHTLMTMQRVGKGIIMRLSEPTDEPKETANLEALFSAKAYEKGEA